MHGIPCAQTPLPVLCTAVPSESDDPEEVGTGTPIAGAMQGAVGSGTLTTAGICATSCLRTMAAAGELASEMRGTLLMGGVGAEVAGEAFKTCGEPSKVYLCIGNLLWFMP